jgi:hypothetical protein
VRKNKQDWTRLAGNTLKGDTDMAMTRFEIATRSTIRTFIFAVLAALYTQYTAHSNSTIKEYVAVAGAALVAAVVRGFHSFLTASSISVKG